MLKQDRISFIFLFFSWSPFILKAQREKEKAARKNQKEKLMQSHTDNMSDTGVMDNLLEALQSGKLFQAGTSTGTSSNSGGGRGRRPPRRDHNAMLG